MQRLDEELARLGTDAGGRARGRKPAPRGAVRHPLAELYAKVADEYPGERKKKARPMTDPQ